MICHSQRFPVTDPCNPWTTLSSRRFYESRYVDVDQDEVRHRSGKIHPYTALRFRIHGIAVLPIFNDGSTILTGSTALSPSATPGNSRVGQGRRAAILSQRRNANSRRKPA